MAKTIAGLILSRDASNMVSFIASTGKEEAVFLEGFKNFSISIHYDKKRIIKKLKKKLLSLDLIYSEVQSLSQRLSSTFWRKKPKISINLT